MISRIDFIIVTFLKIIILALLVNAHLIETLLMIDMIM